MSSHDLTRGSIKAHLWNLAQPMAVGIAANMSFNLVDTYFVAQLGPTPLAAVGFCFPVVFFLFNLSIGTSIGIASMVSRLHGSKRTQDAKSVAGDALFYGAILYTLINLAVFIFLEPIFTFLGANQEVAPFIRDYMSFMIPAIFLRSLTIDMTGVFRGYGNTKIPSRLILVTAGLNLIFDPILIFGLGPFPGLGVQGAGLATFLANIISSSFAFYLLVFENKMVNFRLQSFSKWLDSTKKVAHIALPASISNALNPLTFAFVNYLLSSLGNEAVAGYSVGVRFFVFGLIPLLALSAASGPIVGQNFGSDSFARIREALSVCYRFAVLWAFLMAAAFYLLSPFFAGWIVDKKEVQRALEIYLQITPIGMMGYGAVMIASSAFNAIGHPFKAMLFAFFRTLLFWVPLTSLGLAYFGKVGLFSGELLSNIAAGSIAGYFSLRYFKKTS
jgi:putative MATE family efflux protein